MCLLTILLVKIMQPVGDGIQAATGKTQNRVTTAFVVSQKRQARGNTPAAVASKRQQREAGAAVTAQNAATKPRPV